MGSSYLNSPDATAMKDFIQVYTVLHWTRTRNLVKVFGILCVTFTEVCSVEPKPTSTNFISLATATIANVIDSVVGNNKVETSTEDVTSMHDYMENARAKVADALSNILPDNDVISESVESLKQSLPDFQRIRENLNDWNWDRFAKEILPSAGQDLAAASEEDEAYMDGEAIPPECAMTAPEIIRHAGYLCEVHQAETNDGYLLELHRIPFGKTTAGTKPIFSGKTRPVVFFQHGLLADSTCWIANGAQRSLPFILADAGCDVWLGNVRGSTYSRVHKELDPNIDEKYWRFTWQHMAQSDLPAMVNKALRISGKPSLYYVGHSQGTLIAFARLAEDPLFNDKIKMFFALGPVSTLANITSPARSLVPLLKPAHLGFSLFGGAEILPKKALSQWISAKLHAMDKSTANESFVYRGGNMMMYMCGVHPDHYHDDRLPVYFSHTPAGTSLQNLLHLGQLVESGKMHKWDYMSDVENKKAYGQISPPEYDITRIRTPVALFVGGDDQLAHPVDSKLLSRKLKNLFKYQVLEGWDHLDFLWGKKAVSTVYKDVLHFINNLELAHQRPSRRTTMDEL